MQILKKCMQAEKRMMNRIEERLTSKEENGEQNKDMNLFCHSFDRDNPKGRVFVNL